MPTPRRSCAWTIETPPGTTLSVDKAARLVLISSDYAVICGPLTETMYTRFFGLEDEPFRLTPDPRYLFLSTKHAEALAHLRLGLTESGGFVCITGDVGTGKTTLLRAFLAELGPNVTAAYSVVPPLSTIELLRRMCGEFGLATSGQSQSQLIEELHAYLLAQHQAGRLCVLVLDEAQALSVELLEQIRLLLNLETETQKLLRIVLVGQPQLRKLLLDPDLAQLNQRITLRWHLGPLSYRETAAYVAHRISVAAGGRTPRLFTHPALRFLHSVAGGVPRIINMVGHRALLAALVAREPRVNRRLVARAYREIQAVPLPGTLSVARQAAWSVAGLAIGVSLVAFGAPQLERLMSHPLPNAPPETASTRVHERQDAYAVAAVVPVPTQMLPLASAPVAPGMPALPRPAVPASSRTDLAQRLTNIKAETSARAATEALIALWGEPSLGADETSENPAAAAWRRGLQLLELTGNRSMLRLLDLPAVVVLRVPGAKDVRYAALVAMDTSRIVLSIEGTSTNLEPGVFDEFWSGQAYVFWRDFEGLGPVLRVGVRGLPVMRLQQLLHQAGAFGSNPTGVFDATTANAVLSFQRSHQLVLDGIVGPFTQIVLYATVSDHQRPTLAMQAQAS